MKKIFIVGALVSVLIYSVAVSAEKSFKQEIKQDGSKADAVSLEEQEKQARQAKFEASVRELKKKQSNTSGDAVQKNTATRNELPDGLYREEERLGR